MTDIADLEKRVIALEAAQGENTKTLNWVVGTLGRVAADVSGLKDDVRKLDGKLDGVAAELRADIAGLRRDLPGMLTEAVREGMKGK